MQFSRGKKVTFDHLRLPDLRNSLHLLFFFQFLFKYQFCSARSIAPYEHSSDGRSMEAYVYPPSEKDSSWRERLWGSSQGLEERKPLLFRWQHSKSWESQNYGWSLTHLRSAGSPEPAVLKMSSTRLSQGSPTGLEEQELPPCMGCPEISRLSPEPNLLLSTWQNWERLPLTEAQSYFF